MNKETLYNVSFRRLQGLRRSLLFCCFLLGIVLPGSVMAQITGPSVVCSGVGTVFNLTGTPNPSYVYTWSVIPPGNSTILSSSPTSATIQWFNTVSAVETVQVVITRPSPLPAITWQKVVTVMPAPDPQISTSSKVACQGVRTERTDDPKATGGKIDNIIIDDGVCMKVCENSTVQYDVMGGQPGSTFQWAIDPLKGSFAGPSTGPTVNVTWGSNLGFTFIKVKETTTAGCVKEKTVCIEIIESPHPLFSVNGDVNPVNPPCFEACTQALIQFADLTPNPLSSPIVAWQWNFGDGVYSSIQHPSHAYAMAGTYGVELTVTNQCGCKATYKVCIKVSDPDNPPLTIQCPSIVCENAIGHYTIANTCPSMFWTVNGGTIVNSSMTSVDIMWDNVGPDGFGEIIADFSACGGNCGPKVTAQVPVILATGTIQGKSVVCYGQQYKFTLPQWPATNFTWSIIPAGAATIMSFNQNSHEVELIAYSAFTLHCEYINTLMLCAGKADKAISVVMPMTLVSADKVCLNTSTSVVTTSPAAPGTTYTFIDPNGNTSTSGVFDVTGTWTVQAVNPNYCDIDPISVKVVDPPAPVSNISGQKKVCLNTPYVYEAISPIPNTSCNWVITPAAAGTILSNSGNAVTIRWNTLSPTATLTVSREWSDLPGCSSTPINITIEKATPAANISGNTTPCANTSYPYTATLTALSSPIDNVFWSLSNPAVGSVSSGQNTMTPTFTWNNTTAPTTPVTIICSLTKCGTTTIINYPVTVIGIPTVSLSGYNPTPCSGVPVNCTATTVPAGASITWSMPGGSPPSGTGATTSTTFTNLGLASQNFSITATASVPGCILTGSATVTIAVKPQPNINVSPGSGTSSTIVTCPPVNVPLLLSTNATTSILWYNGGTFIPGTSGAMSYTATSTGTYRVDVTNSFGCSSSVTRVVALGTCTPGCTPPAGAGVTSKSHIITSCANSSGQALVNVAFNGIYGNYPSTYPPYTAGDIASLSVSGSGAYISLPSLVTSGFPNATLTGVTVTKPGSYPVTLTICYETPSGTPCCIPVTENVIVPVIADFDYTVNCTGSGYTLTLNNQSPIFTGGGYSLSTQTWNTTGSGPTTGASTINLSLYTPGSTLTITNTVTVTGPGGPYTCTRTRTFTVPTVPVPSISISTTDPTAPNTASCAMREVVFTGTTGASKWTWAFGDGTGFISNSSNLATRTYTNPGSTYSATVSLTLTDAFGCNFSTTKPLTVRRNTFVLNTVNTYNLPEDIKCQGSFSPVTLVGVTGGYGGNSYAWSNEEVLLPSYVSNPINVTQDGLYWAMVTDMYGCKQAGNPTPAKRAFQPLPDVAITGNHDFCPFQAIKLSAANGGTGITYQWQQFTGSWVNIPGATAAVLNMPGGQPAGVYQYRVNATQTLPSPYTGSCTATSPAFVVTVHANPNYPAISAPVAVNCADYSIQLNVASPQPGEIYNWSNGTNGNSTIVNHGGAYRVWATNMWGCTNYADVDVPLEPQYYFWRFPHGCYSFCRTQLPRRVDGPSYIPFTAWEWYLWGSSLPWPNGPWASSGAGTAVDPLNIHLDPPSGGNGNGSGDYSWYLKNPLCDATSHTMNIQVTPDCCEIGARLAYFRCEWLPGSTSPTYYGGIDLFGYSCPNATYTVYALDPVTGLPNGTVSPASGVYTGGMINFAYNPLPGVNSVKFQVVVNCDGKDCITTNMEIIWDLKKYPCRDMSGCETETKWDYFKCVWPKGYPNPYFVGQVGFNNPLGCDPTSYTIYAVDPATNMINGTVSPSTGSIPSGWSTLAFSYTPNPGETKVKFIIVFICDGHVCYATLGEFDGLDDRERYPCKDYFKMVQPDQAQSVKMLIAPNPASNNVQISYDIPNWKQGDLYKIAIVNLLGQSVAEYTVTGNKGAWQYTTVQLSSGTYLVRLIKDGAKIDVQRMIIAH